MRVLKSAHLGFTITEIMIVFSIIAMLTLLSATALQSANKDNIVQEATQQLLNGMREVQNRAVGVSGENGKAWAMELNPQSGDVYGYTIYKYTENRPATTTGSLKKEEVSKFTFNNNIQVKVSITDPPDVVPEVLPTYIAYNVPFGRSFITINDPCTCDTGACKATGTNVDNSCNWRVSTRYEKDWQLPPNGTPLVPMMSMNINKDNILKIEVSFKSAPSIKKTIDVKASGDANVE